MNNSRSILDMDYIVRRLTPVECERLMGLPDGYTTVHFTEEMLTDELLDEFIEVKFNWDTINYTPKFKEDEETGEKKETSTPPSRKSRAAIKNWLLKISAEPPDAPRYKACGNGWAANQPRWIVMNLLNTQYPGWDETPVKANSHGINPQNGSTMFPCSNEVGQTLAVGHGGGTNGYEQGSFRVGADKSNSMLSDNPHSGFPKVNVSPTLDCTIPTPSKNQGGLVITHKKGN